MFELKLIVIIMAVVVWLSLGLFGSWIGHCVYRKHYPKETRSSMWDEGMTMFYIVAALFGLLNVFFCYLFILLVRAIDNFDEVSEELNRQPLLIDDHQKSPESK